MTANDLVILRALADCSIDAGFNGFSIAGAFLCGLLMALGLYAVVFLWAVGKYKRVTLISMPKGEDTETEAKHGN